MEIVLITLFETRCIYRLTYIRTTLDQPTFNPTLRQINNISSVLPSTERCSSYSIDSKDDSLFQDSSMRLIPNDIGDIGIGNFLTTPYEIMVYLLIDVHSNNSDSNHVSIHFLSTESTTSLLFCFFTELFFIFRLT